MITKNKTPITIQDLMESIFILYRVKKKNMGNGPSSENYANLNLSAIASVLNLALQNCSQTLTEDEVNNIILKDSKVKDLVINQDESIVLKVGCLQSEEATTQLSQALQAAASQTATSIAQQLELSSSESKNVIKISANMASSIKNEFVEKCVDEISEKQVVNIQVEDSEIGNLILKQKDFLNDLVTCSTKGTVNQKLVNDMTVSITQKATAKIESFFTPFLIALAMIIGIIALFLFLPSIFKGRKSEDTRNNSGEGGGFGSGLTQLEEAVGSTGDPTGGGGGGGGGDNNLLGGAKKLLSENGGGVKGAESSVAGEVEKLAS